MSATPWVQFRKNLFEWIEQRWSRTAALFRQEKIHLFIIHCSRLFTAPGTTKAQEAQQAIENEGTFLLVADSLADFWALFPPLEGEADTSPEPAQLGATAPTPPDKAARSVRDETEHLIDVIAEEEKAALEDQQAEEPPPPQRPQPGKEARRSSGRPFRR